MELCFHSLFRCFHSLLGGGGWEEKLRIRLNSAINSVEFELGLSLEISEKYESIYEDNVLKQIEVYKRFEENFKTREQIANERERKIQSKKMQVIKRKAPGDPLVDPLDCKLFSIG